MKKFQNLFLITLIILQIVFLNNIGAIGLITIKLSLGLLVIGNFKYLLKPIK